MKTTINYKKELQKKIRLYSKKFKYNIHNNFELIDSHSWFDINISKQEKLFDNFTFKPDEIDHDGFITRQINIYPTVRQLKILLKWLNCYTLMYNSTTNYFKKCRFEKTKCTMNITQLKTLLKKEKEKISKWSELNFIVENTNKTIKKTYKLKTIKYKTISIDSHLLDGAINDALMRYKSCLTNLKNGNIKFFRLRYLKMTKKNRIFKIEKLGFTKSGLYFNSLGKINSDIDLSKIYEKIVTTSILKYEEGKFKLYIKRKAKDESDNEKYKNKTDTISFDAGVRTLLTGYATNEIVKIGTKQVLIIERLKVIDKIKSRKDITEKKKEKIIRKKYKKIKDMVTDMHWKTIKFITDNYKTVIIGNWSTKSTGELKSTQKMTKRVAGLYSVYQFKMKLKYKSKYTNTEYKEVEENYTSKCCSNCGNYNKDLGTNKIYNCMKCGIVVDRDVNGAVNILIKAQ